MTVHHNPWGVQNFGRNLAGTKEMGWLIGELITPGKRQEKKAYYRSCNRY